MKRLLTLSLFFACGALTSVAAAASYRGRWVEGDGDPPTLEAIDAAFESTLPSAKMDYHMDGKGVAQHLDVILAQPLAHVAADRNPKLNPLVGVDNDRVCVTILKPTADGKASIVRLRSLSDQPEPVNLAFPAGAPKSVRVCPIEETAGEPVAGPVSLLPTASSPSVSNSID